MTFLKKEVMHERGKAVQQSIGDFVFQLNITGEKFYDSFKIIPDFCYVLFFYSRGGLGID